MKKDNKTPESLISENFGFCTLEMLRGNCKTCKQDPLTSVICEDGLPHSDIVLLKKAQYDESIQALVNMRLRPRVVQSSESVVGTRHISLSQAWQTCQSASAALDAAMEDAKTKLSNSESSNDGNVNSSNE